MDADPPAVGVALLTVVSPCQAIRVEAVTAPDRFKNWRRVIALFQRSGLELGVTGFSVGDVPIRMLGEGKLLLETFRHVADPDRFADLKIGCEMIHAGSPARRQLGKVIRARCHASSGNSFFRPAALAACPEGRRDFTMGAHSKAAWRNW